MTSPVIEVRVDWRTLLADEPSITNDGFETNTSGWATDGGTQGLYDAGATLSRITSDDYIGSASGEVVAGAANRGVHWQFEDAAFLPGVTYTAHLAIKLVSGTGDVLLTFGNADENAAHVTGAAVGVWTEVTIDWTPTEGRFDVEFVASRQTASGTFLIDHIYLTSDGDYFDSSPFNAITNDGFETNTTGWSVSAGINAAATSITRSTATPLFAGTAQGRLVTTATNTSGVNWDFGTRVFIGGRAYTAKVALRSVSGTTSAKLLIGSNGTGSDRASTTITLTTSWTYYTVTWTPTGMRTDVQLIVTNGSAAAMTADLDDAGVYESFEDITSDVLSLSWTRGANFDGSAEAAGTATLKVNNATQRYDKDNASSPLYGLIKTGRGVWIRATYANELYALFYGTLRRCIPNGKTYTAEIHCSDPLFNFGRAETSVVASTTRTINDFRDAILDDIGEPSTRRDLSSGDAELTTPYTGADQVLALGRLNDLNKATASIHYIRPHTSSAVLYQYVTRERMELATEASAESFSGLSTGVTDLSDYDFSDESVVNSQRVRPRFRTLQAETTVWEYAESQLPVTWHAGTTSIVWANFSDPVTNQAVVIDAANSPTTVLTPFSSSAKIAVTAGVDDTVINSLSVTGTPLVTNDPASFLVIDQDSIDEHGERRGSEIESDYIQSQTFAEALAGYHVARYAEPIAKPTLQLKAYYPASLEREVGERITATVSSLSIASKQFLIRSLNHTVIPGISWQASYPLEEYPMSLFFILDTSTLDSGRLGF